MKKKSLNLKLIINISLFSAISLILMFFETPLPFLPPFLKIDLSNVPATVTVLIWGLLPGILIELIKNILHLMSTKTFGVGELANFLIAVSYLVPLYYLKKKFKLIYSFIFSTISMTLVAVIINLYILIPLYQKVFKITTEQLINISQLINPAIDNLLNLIILGILPFNLIKGIFISIVVHLIYKRLKGKDFTNLS